MRQRSPSLTNLMNEPEPRLTSNAVADSAPTGKRDFLRNPSGARSTAANTFDGTTYTAASPSTAA